MRSGNWRTTLNWAIYGYRSGNLTVNLLNINLKNIIAFKVLQGAQVDKLDGPVNHHIFDFKQWRACQKFNRIDIARKKDKANE